jgi:hypothetical protein
LRQLWLTYDEVVNQVNRITAYWEKFTVVEVQASVLFGYAFKSPLYHVSALIRALRILMESAIKESFKVSETLLLVDC